ncbi:protein kinase [Xylariaceae sp. FL0662B]|nr:protein kinase [Xylariaceae sp. FL0662B]
MGQESKRLGLDDPNRVQQISSRGERSKLASDAAYQRCPRPIRYNPISGDVYDLLGTIGQELDGAKVASALDETKRYVPMSMLPKIITPERVRALVGGLPCFRGYPDKNTLTETICFGPFSCRVLLAVLIGMEKIEDLPKFMRDGMNDQCLPMEIRDTSNQTLYCWQHKKYHQTINERERNRRPVHREHFAWWSYSLTAPFIRCSKEIHRHYIMDPGDVFPMGIGLKVPKREMPGMSHSLYGGYSEVYQVTIDRSHYDFGDLGMRHPDGLFALKRLNSHSREDFNLELSSLLFSMDQASAKKANKHLIQLLATFEVLGAQGSTYYLLFDWAEGNLSRFWKEQEHLVGRKSHCKWMSEQCHEICLALQCVHNERLETLRSIDTSTLERDFHERAFDVNELYGRHGDIKPDNLLWFRPEHSRRPEEMGFLALADFGLGRLHTQVSRSKQDPRDLTWTATYRAPEFDLTHGMISRKSDIYSMGGVFLEYITWFMLGVKSVEDTFPERRYAQDIHGFEVDTFFTIRQDPSSGRQVPLMKTSVADWIQKLQNHKDCSWYLFKFLKIIRDDMLQPDRNKRINSIMLTKKIGDLRSTCERDSSFYLKTRYEE